MTIPVLIKRNIYKDSRSFFKELWLKKKKTLFVSPYNWIIIFFNNNKDSLLTLCNYKYDKKEYILELDKFKKIISK
jgi:hypothetical protein